MIAMLVRTNFGPFSKSRCRRSCFTPLLDSIYRYYDA